MIETGSGHDSAVTIQMGIWKAFKVKATYTDSKDMPLPLFVNLIEIQGTCMKSDSDWKITSKILYSFASSFSLTGTNKT